MRTPFAKRLRELRLSRGMQQIDLADRLGAGYLSRVAHWETGRHYPYVTDLPRIAELLGVTTDFLLTGHESPQMELIALRLDAANAEIAALRMPRRPFRIGMAA